MLLCSFKYVFWKKSMFTSIIFRITLKCLYQKFKTKMQHMNKWRCKLPFFDNVFCTVSVCEFFIFFFKNKIFKTQNISESLLFTMSYSQTFIIHLSLQIAFIKWEQKHRALDTYLKSDYTRYKFYEDDNQKPSFPKTW